MENNFILETNNLIKTFGGLTATDDLSLKINKQELRGIIGPNGAGKTTLFNLISGYYTPDKGEIIFDGDVITSFSPDKVVKKGIGRTFQKIRIMENTKVINYLKTAFFDNINYNIFDVLFKTERFVKEENKIEERALELLNLFNIEDLADKKIDELAYGEQRRASICRALALNPKILLLDEPTAGLNIKETDDIVNLVLDIKEKFDLTILIIEHDMKVIMDICDQITAIHQGTVLAEGPPRQIQNNERVVESYLGGN